MQRPLVDMSELQMCIAVRVCACLLSSLATTNTRCPRTRIRHPRPPAGPRDTAPDVALAKTVSEQDETLHSALRSLTILGDAGHVHDRR